MKIKAIKKGYGEFGEYYSTEERYKHIIDTYVHEIRKEQVSHIIGEHDNSLDIIVYRGYNCNGELLFEIESNSQLTIWYYETPI